MSARILLLTPDLPYPPQQGASLRNLYILRGLADRYRVGLLSYEADGPGADTGLRPLLEVVERVPFPRRGQGRRLADLLLSGRPDMFGRLLTPEFRSALRRVLLAGQWDAVQIEGLELAWTMPTIREVSPPTRIVYDAHNAETELQRRAFSADLRRPGRWPAAAYSWLQISRLARLEGWACRQADRVTAVSEVDANSLLRLAPGLPHEPMVVPNCIDVGDYLPEDEARPLYFDLLFTGKMDYRPNVDAVLWFAEEIWPLVVGERPQTTWAIVGQKPQRRLAPLSRLPGVTVTGRVARVQPYLAGAKLFIMPFRVASGSRLKVLEALAAGRAVVSTSAGVEGFPAQSGRDLCLAGTAQEFGQAVLRLLADEEERVRLGTAGQSFAAAYDWRQVIPRFYDLYDSLIPQPPPI